MTVNFPRYPSYKNSGIEWLGVLPDTWTVSRIKWLASGEYKSFTDGDWIESPYITDNGVRLIQTGNIGIGKYKEKGFRYISDVTFTKLRCTEINPNDIMICRLADPVGRACLAPRLPERMITSVDVCILKPKATVDERFAVYFLSSDEYLGHLNSSSRGGTRQRVSRSDLGDVAFALPSTAEQRTIADFLDNETAKIDTLIEKQQQLIKLLKEKRQAVISHAVTKGLNPDAPMKNSGVEWLGQVPEHWEVVRLKYLINLFEQGWSPQCDSRPASYDEFGVLKVGCVNSGIFNPEENKALPNELTPQLQYLVKKGDLLISRANTKDLVGSAAVVDEDYKNLILCDKLYRIRFLERVNPDLVACYLSTPRVRSKIEIEATGASHSMQNIGQSTIKDLVIALPPQLESEKVMSFLADETKKYNLAISRSEESIKLLQERRTALISAAVTGKIDVRNFKADDANVA
jgi:type I restriction enzyme S subunit